MVNTLPYKTHSLTNKYTTFPLIHKSTPAYTFVDMYFRLLLNPNMHKTPRANMFYSFVLLYHGRPLIIATFGEEAGFKNYETGLTIMRKYNLNS